MKIMIYSSVTSFTFSILLCLSLLLNVLGDSRNYFYDYATVQPILLRQENEAYDPSTQAYSENLILKFEAFSRTFIANLEVNKDLITSNYFELYQENGLDKILHSNGKERTRCFYRGSMPGFKNSWAAISICKGISGVLHDGENSYYLEPDNTDQHQNHFVFRASDAKQINFTCGLKNHPVLLSGHDDFEKKISEMKSEQASKDYTEQLYVELLMVNDHGEYEKMHGDRGAIFYKNLDIVNIINGLYSSAKIKFSLVGVVIWNDNDKITVHNDIMKLLGEFTDYRLAHLNRQYPNDVAIFFTTTKFGEGMILGASNIDRVCDDSGVSVITDHEGGMNFLSLTFAHEMGHSLGMWHDEQLKGCTCDIEHCIMSFSADEKNVKWSSCSQKIFDSLHNGSKSCLLNVPTFTYN